MTRVFSRDKKGEIISFTTQSRKGQLRGFVPIEKLLRDKRLIPTNALNQYVERYQFGAGYFMIIKRGRKTLWKKHLARTR
jgi:hypothetical protein